MLTSSLVFDPTATEAGSNVGAYIRAGDDGDLIASQTIAAEEWLNTASSLFDGSGNPITSSGSALDVNIQSSDIDVALGDTAIENTATAVSILAVPVVVSALADRRHLMLANEGNKGLYYGKAGVTTTNGFPLYPREKVSLRVGPSVVVEAIGEVGASSEDLRVMEIA